MSSFDTIVVTSSNTAQCELFRKELLARKGKLLSSSCRILALSDPLGVRVGSGGATLHAIAEAYEQRKSLLILHSGGDSRRNPLCSVSGKAFASLNFDPRRSMCECPLDRLLEQLAKLPVTKGVLVAATDTLMTSFEWTSCHPSCFADDIVTGVGIHAPWDFGTRHGVYYRCVAPEGEDEERPFGILQKADEQVLRSNNAIDEQGKVLLDSGIIHFGEQVVETLIKLMSSPPFLGLTKPGIDSGIHKPVRFELYTDILGALKGVWPRDDYMKSAATKSEEDIRTILCRSLERYRFVVLELADDCEFIHVGTTYEHRELAIGSSFYDKLKLVKRCNAFEAKNSVCAEGSVLINSHIAGLPGQSRIEADSLIEHCRLTGFFRIGKGAIVSQVDSVHICVEEGMVLQQVPVDARKVQSRFPQEAEANHLIQDALNKCKQLCVFAIFGVSDGIKDVYPSGTFGNRPWSEMERYANWLWPETNQERSLWTARLFPLIQKEDDRGEEVAMWLMNSGASMDDMLLNQWKSAFRVSMSDLVWITDVDAVFEWKYEHLPSEILNSRIIQAILKGESYPVECLQFRIRAAAEQSSAESRRARGLLQALDHLCFTSLDEGLCARALSLIADMLAGDREPRSGDAGHPAFAPPLLELARSNPGTEGRRQAIQRLATLRDSPYWSETLDSLTRVARHYDTASQSLTGRCLFTEHVEIAKSKSPMERDVWVHATAPARIDLAGGWSDTPPITNESGGIVCNVAVTIHPDVHCLGASARTFSVPGNRSTFVLRIGHYDELPTTPSEIVTCASAQDFDDHFNPRAPGALAKCILLALRDLNKLMETGYGVELCLWSELPPGSGLGGSSILAACGALAASKVLDLQVTREDIVRTVLRVEQLLSTGGGWQDQIGAIYPEFKVTRSEPKLPIHVDVTQMSTSQVFLTEFQKRTILVQTGPARLARDLLQNVVRRWHRREPSFTHAIETLRKTATRMSETVMHGDMDGLCRELTEYWRLKKFVTGEEQAEPQFIQDLFAKTDHLTAAHSLCGAGGGGFAVFIVKEQVEFQEFASVITEAFPGMIAYPAHICSKGLRGWREDRPDEAFVL